MGEIWSSNGTSCLGPWVRELRLYLKLTQKEIARIARVRQEDINLLERNQPLSSEIKSRILAELNNIRVRNWDILTNC